jgi:hypothetical protein
MTTLRVSGKSYDGRDRLAETVDCLGAVEVTVRMLDTGTIQIVRRSQCEVVAAVALDPEEE